MISKVCAAFFGIALLAAATPSMAAGELQLFNYGNYTSPELIKKFEQTYDVKVTVTEYDSSDTAIAKIRAGGHGFDLVVAAANYMPIWVSEGLLLETRPDQMENFKNVDERWVNVEWDPGRHYSVPWQWGLAGAVVDTSVYKGDINTHAIWLDPPAELAGKINVPPEMNDVLFGAIKYLGGQWCTSDKDLLKKVRDKLTEAKPKWVTMDFETVEKFASRDIAAALYWNGAAFRSRLANPDVRFGYPKEGFAYFMDSVAVVKDAKNVENAKLFQNFIMAPENAALISNFAKHDTGIKGTEPYLDADLKAASERTVPAEFQKAGEFIKVCPSEVGEVYTAIWTELMK